MSHNEKYYQKKLKRNAVMSRNIAFMLQPKVLSNAALNNNQALDNNPTSVVETNSSEKEITNAEEQQERSSNDSKVKLHRYLKILIPRKMLLDQILIFQVVLILPKNYRSTNRNIPQTLM